MTVREPERRRWGRGSSRVVDRAARGPVGCSSIQRLRVGLAEAGSVPRRIRRRRTRSSRARRAWRRHRRRGPFPSSHRSRGSAFQASPVVLAVDALGDLADRGGVLGRDEDVGHRVRPAHPVRLRRAWLAAASIAGMSSRWRRIPAAISAFVFASVRMSWASGSPSAACSRCAAPT